MAEKKINVNLYGNNPQIQELKAVRNTSNFKRINRIVTTAVKTKAFFLALNGA